jgi:hypothetical protein
MFREYKVLEIEDVHDGDTITVHLDQGLDQCHTINLRLLGVFAAELNKPGGKEVRSFVTNWFDKRPSTLAGPWPLTCYTAKTKGGKEVKTLGRWVGDIHDDKTGESLCLAIMAWLVENPSSAGGTGKPEEKS